MIKIAFIIDTIATPGAGTEKQLLLLLEKLDRNRFAPQLICLRDSAWLQANTLPVPVKVLNCGSMKSLSFISDLRRLSAFLRAERFQIAQTFFVDGNIYGTVAAHFAGIPTIVSSRRNLGYWHNRVHVAILRFLRSWTSHYLANSQAVIEQTVATERVDRARTALIYNGLDLHSFQSRAEDARDRVRQDWRIAEDEILIGSVANLRAVKNLDRLIVAAAKLAGSNHRIRLVVVGEGDEREAYQRLIDESDMRDRFQLVGAKTDIVACLAAFDIAALVSQSEGFSNSLIEYMAAGKPIVASAVGGNIEAIKHERTGLLFDIADPDGLLAALGRLVADRELAARLARAARQEGLSKYAWQTCVESHEQFYASIVGTMEKSR